MSDECIMCREGFPPDDECPESQRPCGHHCNCFWANDHCHWCGFTEGPLL